MDDVHRYARTFSEYVDTIATNSSSAAILDWWRRLDATAQAARRSLA